MPLYGNNESLQDRINATGGRSSGFDYLRLALASSIILWHGLPIAYGAAVELTYWRNPLGVLMHFVLPMFFALSGFLVAGSLERTPSLYQFLGLRALRIVPALAVEILLSALLLGPVVTQLPLNDYFSDPVFARYFLNVIGYIHYQLPGVFLDNPLPGLVNAQLWTIPFELQCYVALAILSTMGLKKRPWIVLLLVLVGQVIWIKQGIQRGDDGSSNGASGPTLLLAFLMGLLFYQYRSKIPSNRWIFWLLLPISFWLSSLPHGAYYLPIPATYITVYLGLLNPKKIWAVASGDYSYGLFLYGYPIQQFVSSTGAWSHHWAINVALALPAAALVSYLSWHGIEKKVLALRRWLPVSESYFNRRFKGASIGHAAPAASAAPASGRGAEPDRVVSQPMPSRPAASLKQGITALIYAMGLAGVLLLLNAREPEGVMLILFAFAARATFGRMMLRQP